MLRILPQTRDYSQLYRLALIIFFSLFTALAAQIEIFIGGPVPFTLQVLAVLLAGMVLGARDGALSQVAYVLFIRFNLPFAAGGAGMAALTGTTAGYLVGFIPAAFVAGYLVERGAGRVWQRWLAGFAGICVIYAFGLPVLKAITGADWSQTWAWGAMPFLGLDLVKALVAAVFTESGRSLLLRRS